MNLCDRDKNSIVEHIKTFYSDNEPKFKTVFTKNQEIFGFNFYSSVPGNDFNTRIINLVEELIKKEKLEIFIEYIKKEYPKFCCLLNIPFKIIFNQLIEILYFYWDRDKKILLKVYNKTRPSRTHKINPEQPNNATKLINGLNIQSKKEWRYYYIEKFVIDLIENYLDLSIVLKEELKSWSETYIDNYEDKREHIEQEKIDEQKRCNPCLFVAISSEGNKYYTEAWLVKNISQYHRESSSDCEFLIIENQQQFSTDEKLTNLPILIKKFIKESLNRCKKYLKQIHVFLPSHLMNYGIDCWENWQDDDDGDDDDYKTSIEEEYEVILRFSEHLRGQNNDYYKWLEKGEILKNKVDESVVNILLEGNENSPKTLFKKFKGEEIIAVKIINVFEKKEPGTLLRKAGIPVAIWIREQLTKVDIAQELENLLQQDNQYILLKELPKRVKMVRGEDTVISKCLCLLWDEPNLLPPEQLLTSSTIN